MDRTARLRANLKNNIYARLDSRIDCFSLDQLTQISLVSHGLVVRKLIR